MDEAQNVPQDGPQASEQPAAAPTKGQGGVWLLVGGAAVLLCLIGAVAKNAIGGSGSAQATDAKQVCERFVKDQLKAPGSAKFSGATATTTGGGYTVTGDVDAQNTFGASLRSRYTCVVRYDDPTREWRLVSLTGLS